MQSHRRVGRMKRGMRTTGRVQEIVRIMVKYGLSDWVRALRIDRAVPGIRRLLAGDGSHQVPQGASRWEILRMALEELGPSFIKIGQLMSSRSDILPVELVRELSRLQDAVQPIAPELITTALTAELGREIADVITYLDLLADRCGVHIPTALISKWNEVSERIGYEVRL